MDILSDKTLLPFSIVGILLSCAFGLGYTYHKLDNYSQRISILENKIDKLTDLIIDGKIQIAYERH